MTEHGQVRYILKNPWRDGTTHVIFEPLDFTALAHPCARGISASIHVIARLAALVPKPRVNLTRFHGVFAPNSPHRALITPAGRGKGRKARTSEQTPDRTPVERHMAMTWAQRLKRVFGIDIETCQAGGGAMTIIACMEDPSVIRKILDPLDRRAPITAPHSLPEPRAPPPAGLFDTP